MVSRISSSSSITTEETTAEELGREIADVKQKVHADPELLARWIRQQLRQSDDAVKIPGEAPLMGNPDGGPAGSGLVPNTLH
ncbi:MAG: hypothetical protein EBT04_13970 [Betaproteobacteria bacterium]|nr:hypothetical protein [Betaproteobacteria bacterium]